MANPFKAIGNWFERRGASGYDSWQDDVVTDLQKSIEEMGPYAERVNYHRPEIDDPIRMRLMGNTKGGVNNAYTATRL